MVFREINYDNDIEEVVGLLKSNLNIRQNQTHFNWKHVENPYGKSYGMLACDGGKIVAVRMFMQWEFIYCGKIYKAARPVDTVTDQNYRRRGLFTSLNKRAVLWAEKNNDLIFNTPNQQSSPGNLKMGWKKFTKPLYFEIVMSPSLRTKGRIILIPEKVYKGDYSQSCDYLMTNLTPEYIRWRYSDPEYMAAIYEYKENQLYIIYKIIKTKKTRLLLIMNVLGNQEFYSNAIKALSKKTGVFLVYVAGSTRNKIQPKIPLKRSKAVVLYKNDKKGLFENVDFSLGDLEGRI